MPNQLISIVVPFFNEGGAIDHFYSGMSPILSINIGCNFEVICVDDGSTDSTLAELIELTKKDTRFRVLEFSRNFGKEAALSAGIDFANGDGLVYMVIDNENPLERNDSLILLKWLSLKQSEQSKCVQKWTSLGKRVEIENFPCYQLIQKQQPFINNKK